MAAVLVARPVSPWRRVGEVAATVLAVGAHLVLGLLVLVLRTLRVAVNVVTTAAMASEQQLAARTGRTALSHTGIAVLTAALAAEFLDGFRTAYHQPTR